MCKNETSIIFLCAVSVKSLVQLLVRLLPLQSTKSTGEALTLVSMATQLMHIVDVMPEAGGICAELTDICLSLICELTERDIPTLTLIASLVVLVEKMEEVNVSHIHTHAHTHAHTHTQTIVWLSRTYSMFELAADEKSHIARCCSPFVEIM